MLPCFPAEDGTPNSTDNPAPIGSLVTFSWTGGGVLDPPGMDGKVATDPLGAPLATIELRIGSMPAEIISASESPGQVSGVLQLVARIPDGVTTGPAVSVELKVGDTSSQSGVTIAVQ